MAPFSLISWVGLTFLLQVTKGKCFDHVAWSVVVIIIIIIIINNINKIKKNNNNENRRLSSTNNFHLYVCIAF